MEAQTNLITGVLEKLYDLSLFANLTVGPLPAENGISMQPVTGRNDAVYYDRRTLHVLNLLFLSKHDIQMKAYDALCQIGTYLQRGNWYPLNGENYQWIKSEVTTGSQFVTQQENGKYIYSAVVDITAYF